jgi:hypothetical protein
MTRVAIGSDIHADVHALRSRTEVTPDEAGTAPTPPRTASSARAKRGSIRLGIVQRGALATS